MTNTWGEVAAGVTYAAAAAGGAALAVVDWRTKRLPNKIVLPLYGVGVVGLGAASWLEHRGGALLVALIAMAAIFGVLYLLCMFGSLGFGDVKLGGLLGLYLGWLGLPVLLVGLVFGTLLGALTGTGMVTVRAVRGESLRSLRKVPIAFGTFLIIGAALAAALHVA